MDSKGEQTLEVMSTATWYNKWLLSWTKKHLGKSVLEIGAGIGNFTKLLKKDRKVTAVDINRSYLKILKTKFKGKDVVSGYGDIEKLEMPFTNKTFDSIICFNVLEHIKDDILALKNMYKCLKPNGKLILIVPAHQLLFSNFDKSIGHFRRYNLSNLSVKVENTGFKIINVRYLNWVGALGWLLLLKAGKKTSLPERGVGIFNSLAPYLIVIERFIKLPFGLSVFCVAEKV